MEMHIHGGEVFIGKQCIAGLAQWRGIMETGGHAVLAAALRARALAQVLLWQSCHQAAITFSYEANAEKKQNHCCKDGSAHGK